MPASTLPTRSWQVLHRAQDHCSPGSYCILGIRRQHKCGSAISAIHNFTTFGKPEGRHAVPCTEFGFVCRWGAGAIRKIECDIVSIASEVRKIIPALSKRPNLIRAEYAAMESFSDLDIRTMQTRITDLRLIPKI